MADRRWLAIRDFWTLKLKDVLENKRYLFECRDAKSDSGHSLLVHVAATHSGMVNGNRKFYRPDFMQDSVHTWLPKNAYPRPVLIGHNEDGQVLGRVREAKYVDESWKYATEFPILKDSIFYNRDSKRRHNLFKTVDFIVKNLQPLPEYTGLGYIDLGLQVTNPDAIQRVLRDEYLTVSVGSATDEAICSICHTDWASDDKCEHKLGEMVDGQRMFLICGRFKYQECSFVNFPADPFAVVKEKELKDSLEKLFFLGLPIDQQLDRVSSGLVLTDSLYESDIHIANVEDEMTTPDVAAIRTAIESAEFNAAKAFEFKDQLSQWKPESDDQQFEKRSLTSLLAARIKKNGWVKDAVQTTDAATAAEMAAVGTQSEVKDAEVAAAKTEAAEAEVEDAKKKTKKDEKNCCKDCKKEHCTCTDKCQRCGCDEKDSLIPASDDEKVVLCSDCWGDIIDLDPDTKETEDSKKGNESAKYLAKNIPAKGTGKGKVPASNTPEEKRCEKPAEKSGGKKKKKCAACTKDFETADDKIEKCEDCSKPVELTDNTKAVLDVLLKDEKTKDAPTGPGSKLVDLIVNLDKGYAAFKDDDKFYVRAAVRCLVQHWSSDDEFAYWLRALAGAGKVKDAVLVNKTELADKEEALINLTDEKNDLEGKVKAADQKQAIFFKDSKRSLAMTIVMFKTLRGADGFKDLKGQALLDKVDELAKRHITSLKDTVNDIMSELEWVAPAPAANPDDAAAEPEVKVNDNAQVSETETPETPAFDPKELKVQDAAKVQRMAAYITDPTERARFIADVKYGRVKF